MKFDDDGYIPIEVNDHPEVRVDLWRANNQIIELDAKYDTKRGTPEYDRDLLALLQAWGLPPVSVAVASDICEAIIEQAHARKKKAAPAQPTSSPPA